MLAIQWMEMVWNGTCTALRVLALAIVTPLLEKNAEKTVAARKLKIPVVFSMSRVIVLAFAVSMLHQAWYAGVAGWPEATLSIAVVLAIPVLAALERLKPAEAVELVKSTMSRFGIGATHRGLSELRTRPTKWDDHRDDGGGGGGGGDDDDADDPEESADAAPGAAGMRIER